MKFINTLIYVYIEEVNTAYRSPKSTYSYTKEVVSPDGE